MDLGPLLARFSEAVEAGNGDALADLFTDDGVYDDYFFGPSEPGRKGIRDMLAHFYEGGRDFRWEFFDPVASGGLGYASYRFSYTSLLPDAKGARVIFDGISRLEIVDGRIKRYSEVFDRGMALAQQDFAAERLKKIAAKYAARLKVMPEAARHLAGNS
ncbi:MAG: nuclear transport factor 2 family protein [Hyphomicrobiaceae bacterium]|nr:nuclear transport factor 2 family protein [Hyphomicrobiaceae bacterium]